MWKSGDGNFLAGFTGSGIRELHPRGGRREKCSSLLPTISTLHGIRSMGDGIEFAAVGVGRPAEVRKTMREAIFWEGAMTRGIKFG